MENTDHSFQGQRLYRSRIDRMIGGVCGGFAEYFVIDATLMRVLWIIFAVMGFGFIAYIAALIIMNENPDQDVLFNLEIPLKVLGFDQIDTFIVTDLWSNETTMMSNQEHLNLQVQVARDKTPGGGIRVILITPVSN